MTPRTRCWPTATDLSEHSRGCCKTGMQPNSCLFLSFYIVLGIEVRKLILPDFGAPDGMPTPIVTRRRAPFMVW